MTCPHDGPTPSRRPRCGPSRGSRSPAVREASASFRRRRGPVTSAQAIADVTGAMRSLAPLLLAARGRPYESSPRRSRESGRSPSAAAGCYVIAVNAGYDAGHGHDRRARARRTGPPRRRQRPSVVPDGDTFTERFPPLGARVYVTGARPASRSRFYPPVVSCIGWPVPRRPVRPPPRPLGVLDPRRRVPDPRARRARGGAGDAGGRAHRPRLARRRRRALPRVRPSRA